MRSRQVVAGLGAVVLLVWGALVLLDTGPGEDIGPAPLTRGEDGGAAPFVGSAAHGAVEPDAAPVELASGPSDVPLTRAEAEARAARTHSGSVRGRLVDALGRPVAGEPVDLLVRRDAWAAPRHRDEIHDVVDRGVSDEDGRFELGARAGSVHTLLAGGAERPRRRIDPVASGAVLEVEMSEARTLTGTVIEQETGRPVPYARVGAHSGNDRIATRADATGWFSVGPLLDDLVILTGYMPGYDVVVSDPVAPDWGPAVLELPPGRELRGTVVEWETEEPIADATVTLRLGTEPRPAGEADPLEGRRLVHDDTATTDEDGRYVVSGIPSRAFRVIVEAEGYLPSTSDKYFYESPNFEEDLVIGIVPARDLVGLVRHGEDPAVGVVVTLETDEATLASGTTDETGRFAVPTEGWDRIAPLAVQARDRDGRLARRRLDEEALAQELELTLVDELRLEVLVHGAQGPIAGAHVLAASEQGLRTTLLTGDDGRVLMVHPLAGPHVSSVWLTARHEHRESLLLELDISEGAPSTPVVLDVDDGAWFEGVLQDSFGAPLGGATVSSDRTRFVNTDPNGRFLLGPANLGEAGTATLYAGAVGQHTGEWPEMLPARDLVLTLAPVMHWRGRAHDAATGRPLDSFQVRLQVERNAAGAITWEEVEARSQRTGGAGEFSVELAEAGRYRLVVMAQDHITEQTLPVPFDGVREPPFAEVFLAGAAVLAVSVEGPSGEAVPGYQLWLVPSETAAGRDTPAGIPSTGLHNQRTDMEGQARFNLGRGAELRLASGPGGWLDAGPFVVAPGAELKRLVVVPSLGGIDLTVVDAEGEPVGGFQVGLTSSGADATHVVRLGGPIQKARPVVEARLLPDGEYQLVIAHDEYEQETRRVVVVGGRNTPVKIWLRRLPDGSGAGD
jgi:hypothetical protein